MKTRKLQPSRHLQVIFLLAIAFCTFNVAFAADSAPAAPAAPAAQATDPWASPDPESLGIDPSIMHYKTCSPDGGAIYAEYKDASMCYHMVDYIEEASAREVDRDGARPTILSRNMAIALTAMYDAWAAYDDVAVGTRLGGSLRRPAAERTKANKEKAVCYAVFDGLMFVYPEDADWLKQQMTDMGFDPNDATRDPASPVGIGHLAADAVIEYRRNDGSNQFHDMPGSVNDKPYCDYTGYKPVNTVDEIKDPDHWQPITFTKPNGEKITPGFLTPQWGKVKTFAMDSSDQFRPAGPPKYGSDELKREFDQNIRMNANLTPTEIAVVEFMRDGPRSTGQSGHWLRFAQDLSRKNHYDIDQDCKLFFSVGNICMDTFIACWEAKRYYDSSRPWTLIHYHYKGQTIRGWRGPGQGVGDIAGEKWHPYSPESFITPPFPGYPSGHSTVSAGASTILKLFSGTDLFGFIAARRPGALTGEPQDSCQWLELPSWTATADMAGISRVLGGYHIQSDNVDALALGRTIANFEWPRYQEYFNGTAKVRP